MYDLKPFRFWCQKVLPTVYDDSLSYYELLCKTVDYLNKTTSNVDELETIVTDLKNYVDNYFANLDVQEEINNKLDAMVADGTFDKIINETIFNDLNNKVDNSINLTNAIIESGLRERTYVQTRGPLPKTEGDLNYTLEGCYCVGNTLIVSYFRASTKSTSLYVYNISNPASPAIVTSRVNLTNLGHFNNITSDGNLLYACGYEYNSLWSINPVTLETAKVRDLEKQYLNVLYVDGLWYFQLSSNVVDIYDASFKFIKEIIIETPTSAIQGCYYANGVLHFIQSGYCNYIYHCDKEGKCINFSTVFVPDELECMFYYNNQYYIAFNNQSEYEDYMVGVNMSYGTNFSWAFSNDAVGRAIRIYSGDIHDGNTYKLSSNGKYFSHLVFTIATSSGTVIKRPAYYINNADSLTFYVNFSHITNSGGIWICGFDCTISSDATYTNVGYIKVNNMNIHVISNTGTHTVYNMDNEGWGTTIGTSFKILTIDGLTEVSRLLSFPD